MSSIPDGGPTITEKHAAPSHLAQGPKTTPSPYDVEVSRFHFVSPMLVIAVSLLVMAAALVFSFWHVSSRTQQIAFEQSVLEARAREATSAARELEREAMRGQVAEPVAEPEPTMIDVIMVGDILMHDTVVVSGLQDDGSYDFSHLFTHVRNYIEPADVRILNQETVMGLPEKGFKLVMADEVSPAFNTPIELADAEMDAGFNVVIKASNHVFDQGYDGLAHELDYWAKNYPDVPILGVDNPKSRGGDQDWVHRVYIYEKDGFKVAFLNYTFGANTFVDYVNEFSTASFLDETKIASDVAKARAAGADMIVACPHWGAEYKTAPSAEELRYAEVFTSLGVDVVFGTHPHIMQPVEVLTNGKGHKTVCFYSNGNFVAGVSAFANQSMIAGISRVTLVKDLDGTCRVDAASLVPVVICEASGTDMSVWPLVDYNDDLAQRSYRPSLTRSYASDFCADLFGDGFDPATGVYTVDLG